MTNALIHIFIRDAENTGDSRVREKFGVLSGAVGLACNLFLFALKLIIGLLTGDVYKRQALYRKCGLIWFCNARYSACFCRRRVISSPCRRSTISRKNAKISRERLQSAPRTASTSPSLR